MGRSGGGGGGAGCGLHILFTLLMIALGLWMLLNVDLPFYEAWLLTLSVITFSYYGFDKYQARNKGWRVPEAWLFTLSFLGGFLGAWAALFVHRHKHDQLFGVIMIILATAFHMGLIAVGIVEMGPYGG